MALHDLQYDLIGFFRGFGPVNMDAILLAIGFQLL